MQPDSQMESEIKSLVGESITVKESVANGLAGKIAEAVEAIVQCYRNKGKLLVCGNGGSAADAQHFCAELTGRFNLERKPLPCIALATNNSFVTAWSNDYDFDSLFEREVEAVGNSNDLLFGISTSGNSGNVIRAIKKAKQLKMKTIALLGNDGGKAGGIAGLSIIVKSNDTPRTQEAHIMIIHIICALVEKSIFG